MNYKTTIALLVVLIIAGAAVYLQDIRPGPKKEEPKATQVFTVDSKDVNSVNVTYNGQTTELKKEGETSWKLTKPEAVDADYWGVEGTVSRWGSLTASRALTNTVQEPSAYGLDHPMLEATLGTSKGQENTIAVGDQAPDGSAYYVKRDGSDTIFLVATSTISDMIKLVTNPPKATPTPQPVTPGTAPSPAASPAPASSPTGATSPAGAPPALTTPVLPKPPAGAAPGDAGATPTPTN